MTPKPDLALELFLMDRECKYEGFAKFDWEHEKKIRDKYNAKVDHILTRAAERLEEERERSVGEGVNVWHTYNKAAAIVRAMRRGTR